MANKQDAVAGLEVAINLLEAAYNRLRKRIVRRNRKGLDVTVEDRLKARLVRRIAHLERVQAELEAARTVSRAPTRAEIEETAGHIDTLRSMAVSDALTRAGLTAIKSAITAAGDLANKSG